jgi:hypothetical protein
MILLSLLTVGIGGYLVGDGFTTFGALLAFVGAFLNYTVHR